MTADQVQNQVENVVDTACDSVSNSNPVDTAAAASAGEATQAPATDESQPAASSGWFSQMLSQAQPAGAPTGEEEAPAKSSKKKSRKEKNAEALKARAAAALQQGSADTAQEQTTASADAANTSTGTDVVADEATAPPAASAPAPKNWVRKLTFKRSEEKSARKDTGSKQSKQRRQARPWPPVLESACKERGRLKVRLEKEMKREDTRTKKEVLVGLTIVEIEGMRPNELEGRKFFLHKSQFGSNFDLCYAGAVVEVIVLAPTEEHPGPVFSVKAAQENFFESLVAGETVTAGRIVGVTQNDKYLKVQMQTGLIGLLPKANFESYLDSLEDKDKAVFVVEEMVDGEPGYALCDDAPALNLRVFKTGRDERSQGDYKRPVIFLTTDITSTKEERAERKAEAERKAQEELCELSQLVDKTFKAEVLSSYGYYDGKEATIRHCFLIEEGREATLSLCRCHENPQPGTIVEVRVSEVDSAVHGRLICLLAAGGGNETEV